MLNLSMILNYFAEKMTLAKPMLRFSIKSKALLILPIYDMGENHSNLKLHVLITHLSVQPFVYQSWLPDFDLEIKTGVKSIVYIICCGLGFFFLID